MEITDQCVVALTWTLKDTLGEELDVLDEPVEFLVGEVAIGSHRADPQFRGQLAHGHRVRPLLGEQLFGGVAKALAEVGDIGLGQDAGHL